MVPYTKNVRILLDEHENEYELDNALLLGYDEVSVYIDDNVTITNAQRNFAYAIINEIFEAQYGGYSGLDNDGWLVTPESVEQYFKAKYFIRYGEKISLSRSKGRKYDARKPLLEVKDVEFQRALETGADTSTIVSEKQSLRDATINPDIAAASTPEELKASWDSDLLGDSPYT